MKFWISKILRCRRARRLTSVHDALSQLLPAAERENLALWKEEELVSELSRSRNVETVGLLAEVGQVLELPTLAELEHISTKLRTIVPYSEETLRQAWSAPQWSDTVVGGYGIATARPDLLDIAAFHHQGVPVWLTTGEEIIKAWGDGSDSSVVERLTREVSMAQVWATLRSMASEAAKLGAREVFIGHPSEERYEFMSSGSRYTGKVHRGLYDVLLATCVPGAPLHCHGASEDGIEELAVALTKSFDRPVICVSWRQIESGSVGEDRAPLVPADLVRASVSEARIVEPGQCAKQSVLLVDDDERFLLILGRILEGKGWNVTTSIRAEEALELIDGTEFDLVVTDLHMPEMDGALFLERIKLRSPELPVLLLTSDDASEVEAELVLLGADAFVRKQEDPRILLSWCKNLARRRSRRGERDVTQTGNSTRVSMPIGAPPV